MLKGMLANNLITVEENVPTAQKISYIFLKFNLENTL